MNTKMMEQFESMDTDMLACVEGGKKFGDCETAISAGIGVGAVFAGPWGSGWFRHGLLICFFCATPVS